MGRPGEHERPREAGKPVLPCVRCGTLEGHTPAWCSTPRRRDLTRFGVPGLGCQSCYNTLWNRAKGRKSKALAVDAEAEPEMKPKEVRQRVKIIRVVKRLKIRRGLDPWLTMDELNEFLPLVETL